MKIFFGVVMFFVPVSCSHMLEGKMLEPILNNKCTIVLLDFPSQLIMNFQSSCTAQSKATFLVQDSGTVGISHLAHLNQKFAPMRSCYIGISQRSKVSALQEVLLRTHNRVLISLQDKNHTNNLPVFKLDEKHHPIAVLETRSNSSKLYFDCHNNRSFLANIFLGQKWLKEIEVTGMGFERICNQGHHPLWGKCLSVQFNSILPYVLTTATGQITGGIILGLLDIISQKMGFGYKGVYNGESYYNNGTVGGAYGEVLKRNYDFATWIPMNGPTFGGEKSDFIHVSNLLLLQRSPLQLPQYLNLMHTFDSYTWKGTIAGFLLVSVVTCVLSFLGKSELSPKELLQHSVIMNFGIVFQEFHLESPSIKFGGLSSKFLRFLWVVVSCLLTISFQSIPRASLVAKNYDKKYESLQDMIDKDAKFHLVESLYNQLSLVRDLSPVTKFIVEQAEKYNTIYAIGSSSGVGNSFDMESEFLRQGGASFGTGTALRYLAANYIKTGRDLPGLEVPGARIDRYISFFFRKFDPRAGLFQDITNRIGCTGLGAAVYGRYDPYSGVNFYTAPVEEKLILEHFYVMFGYGGVMAAVCLLTFSVEVLHKRNTLNRAMEMALKSKKLVIGMWYRLGDAISSFYQSVLNIPRNARTWISKIASAR